MRSRLVVLCGAVSACVASLGALSNSGGSGVASAAAAPGEPRQVTRPVHAGSVSGESALRRSGARIDAIAASVGWKGDQLTRVLRSDPNARLDAADLAFYVEATASATGSDSQLSTLPGTLTQAEAFTRHSLPGAPLTIYLDFDGAVTSGTQWSSFGIATISSAPFDLDGSPTTWSNTELRALRSSSS